MMHSEGNRRCRIQTDFGLHSIMFLDLENDSMIYVNIYASIYNAFEIFIHNPSKNVFLS